VFVNVLPEALVSAATVFGSTMLNMSIGVQPRSTRAA
jgi:hypothetical protein